MFNYKNSEFSISICVRNSLNQIVGRKEYSTDNAGELAAWYEKNGSNNINILKKKKTKKAN